MRERVRDESHLVHQFLGPFEHAVDGFRHPAERRAFAARFEPVADIAGRDPRSNRAHVLDAPRGEAKQHQPGDKADRNGKQQRGDQRFGERVAHPVAVIDGGPDQQAVAGREIERPQREHRGARLLLRIEAHFGPSRRPEGRRPGVDVPGQLQAGAIDEQDHAAARDTGVDLLIDRLDEARDAASAVAQEQIALAVIEAVDDAVVEQAIRAVVDEHQYRHRRGDADQ